VLGNYSSSPGRSRGIFEGRYSNQNFYHSVVNWERIGKVHAEFFRDIRPASTMVQVAQLLDPDWLVEIEADAIIDADAA